MSMTMLQIVQQAVGEMGSGTVPTSVAGNQNQDTVQQFYLLNGLGQDLQRDFVWQDLNKQYIFTVQFTTITGNVTSGSSSLTNASSIVGLDTTYGISGNGINQACYIASAPSGSTIPLSQPATASFTGATYTLTKVKYALPSDYDRIVDRTQWDKTKHWELLGPESAQQWEWLISGYISTGPRIRWRIFNNLFQIWPFTASAEALGYEYISNGWAFSSGGTAQSAFAADSDTCIYPDRLIVTGLKLRYFDAKGFDTGSLQMAYQRELSIAFANDSGSQTLSFAPRQSGILITQANIADTGYGP